jgi:hypothetical protein
VSAAARGFGVYDYDSRGATNGCTGRANSGSRAASEQPIWGVRGSAAAKLAVQQTVVDVERGNSKGQRCDGFRPSRLVELIGRASILKGTPANKAAASPFHFSLRSSFQLSETTLKHAL